jgi:AraC-like DNA-binding protein
MGAWPIGVAPAAPSMKKGIALNHQQTPLGAHPFFHALDVDSLCEAIETRLCATPVALPGVAKGIESVANFCPLPRSQLWFCSYGVPLSLRFPDSDYVRVQFCHRGSGATRIGRERVIVSETQACISSAAAQIDFGQDFQQVVWRIPSAQLTKIVSALSGAPLTTALDFAPALDLTLPHSQVLLQLLNLVVDTLQIGAPVDQGLVLAELEQALIVSLLCAGQHNCRDSLNRPSAGAAPWQVRRVETYIEAHWNEPLTIDMIAAVTGVNSRSMFRAFKQSRNCTPLEFARRLRLQNARRMLESTDSATTVTEVALACGFSDLGHFSREFHAAYGEKPSGLLKRSKTTAENSTRDGSLIRSAGASPADADFTPRES